MDLTIRLQREDALPAFGAFLRCEQQNDESPVILMNVQSIMAPDLIDNENEAREEQKRILISTLMHEFGHALESHFRLPVNEEAIEAACEAWEKAHMAVLGENAATSTNAWIDADIELPDDEENVLIAFADGEVWTGFRDGDNWRYTSADLVTTEVTHWQRLPEPPNAPFTGLSRATVCYSNKTLTKSER